MTTGPEAGYYADPSIPGYIRYWDGTQWVAGTSRPAHEALEQQQRREQQQAVQQAVAAQLAPAPQPQPQAQPGPQYQGTGEQASVATMVVPSAFGNRGAYGAGRASGQGGGSGSPFDAIPGLYRTVEPDEEEPESQVRVVELASAGSRVLARIIDLGIAAALSAPVTVTLVLVAHRHDHAYVDQLRLQARTTYRTLGLDALGIALWVAALLVVLITAVLFEGFRLPRTGQTTGRRLVGVQVITVGTAENPSGGAAVSRALTFWLLAIVPVLDVIALGGILWGRPYRQGLHEKLSGTLSIRA
jgi:uncharacterized RDD family membrane protein YckC